jgi:hypothetical protein
MTAALATLDPTVISSLVINGDLKGLTNEQRVAYYNYRCQQAGLDAAAKPFDLLTLNGKQILYANASATQQLCGTRGLSVQITAREKVEDIYVVSARVTDQANRTTENTGAVSIGGLKGDSLANAMMKATTKAIRRTVLAHCGLGMLDETETESILGAVREPMDIKPPVAPLVGFKDDDLDHPFNLFIPGQEEPYSRHPTLEDWSDHYEKIIVNIKNSKKLSDDEKINKTDLFKHLNAETWGRLNPVAKVKLMAASAKTEPENLSPKISGQSITAPDHFVESASE